MKRRTYRKLHAEQQPDHHHNVYVVLLNPRRWPTPRCPRSQLPSRPQETLRLCGDDGAARLKFYGAASDLPRFSLLNYHP
jgi:hypothetical protein